MKHNEKISFELTERELQAFKVLVTLRGSVLADTELAKHLGDTSDGGAARAQKTLWQLAYQGLAVPHYTSEGQDIVGVPFELTSAGVQLAETLPPQ